MKNANIRISHKRTRSGGKEQSVKSPSVVGPRGWEEHPDLWGRGLSLVDIALVQLLRQNQTVLSEEEIARHIWKFGLRLDHQVARQLLLQMAAGERSPVEELDCGWRALPAVGEPLNACAESPPVMVIPSEAVKQMEPALAELERAAAAAVALVLMNASMIQAQVGDTAGWEDFESPSFKSGVLELAQMAVNGLSAGLVEWIALLRPIMDRLKGHEDAVLPPPAAQRDQDTLSQQGAAQGEVEMAVYSLRALLDQQGWVITQRYPSGDSTLHLSVDSRLAKAWDAAEVAYWKLGSAFFGVAAAQKPKREAVS